MLHSQIPEFAKIYQLNFFGCTAFVHVHSHDRGELDPRAIKCLFLGYAATKKGYRCFDPVNRKLYISKDVTFFEQQPYYTSLQGENSSEASSWEIPQSPFSVPTLPAISLTTSPLPATSPMSTQISPSIPFVQLNPTIVPIHDGLSNVGGDKALPPTA